LVTIPGLLKPQIAHLERMGATLYHKTPFIWFMLSGIILLVPGNSAEVGPTLQAGMPDPAPAPRFLEGRS
jgi:hypothetical protein